MAQATWRAIDFTNVPGVLDWAGFVLGLIGFLVTIVTLLRTRSSLKAAHDALLNAKTKLTDDQFLSIVPRGQEIERILARALNEDDRHAIDGALRDFLYLTAEAIALFQSDSHRKELVDGMMAAQKATSDARSTLYASTRRPRILVAEATESMNEVLVKMRQHAVTHQMQIGGTNG